MWNQIRSNRLTGEREQIKDHIMHIERLRQVKSTVNTRNAKKPNHMKQNYKKELKTLERMSEIQYQNRILLRKMLNIDLKPSNLNPQSIEASFPKSGSQAIFHKQDEVKGLNSYNSLNRAVRIKNLAKIVDENKMILNKLQNTTSNYDTMVWEKQNKQKKNLQKRICENSDRYQKNPYFLHSVCTHDLSQIATNGQVGGALSNSASNANFVSRKRGSSRQIIVSQSSTQNSYRQSQVGKHKKIGGLRPFSAPKGFTAARKINRTGGLLQAQAAYHSQNQSNLQELQEQNNASVELQQEHDSQDEQEQQQDHLVASCEQQITNDQQYQEETKVNDEEQ